METQLQNIPVSYTHLDVYKRQAPTSLRGGVPGEGLSPSLGFALEGGVPNRTSKTAARGAEAPQQQRPHGILSQELWCLTRSLRSAAPRTGPAC